MSNYDPLRAPAVEAWQAGFDHRPGLLETVSHWVGFDRLLVASRFLWPVFVHHRGCVLLPWEYDPETFDQWWKQLNGDCRQIENTLNHLHLWDVFDAAEIPSEQLIHLAETLQLSWTAALKAQAPNRSFDVLVTNDQTDYGPTVSITSLAPGSTSSR